MNRELARQVARAARETGLSRAELMRQALSFGLPQVVQALRKSSGRLTSVDPLPRRAAAALYRLDDDDQPQVRRLTTNQSFEIAD
ncbi:MAG TPA: ribbon-helix-helix protein, CopG family [Verrucomicrobiota bacterium]|nr:ribbon-helix-helix protein, CopG family [Verrucomicrobiota bacterium]